jgi:hypothetical protein
VTSSTLLAVTDKVTDLLKNPVVAQLAKWGIALLLASKLAKPIIGAFAGIGKSVLIFGKGIGDIGKFFFEFNKNIEKLIINLNKLGGIFTTLARAARSYSAHRHRDCPCVVAVLLLLNHFGKLDDIWQAIKDTAKKFMEDIQPALDSLSDALGEMGIKIGACKM